MQIDYKRQVGPEILLSPAQTKLYVISGKKNLVLLGQFNGVLHAKDNYNTAHIIVNKERPSILSNKTKSFMSWGTPSQVNQNYIFRWSQIR